MESEWVAGAFALAARSWELWLPSVAHFTSRDGIDERPHGGQGPRRRARHEPPVREVHPRAGELGPFEFPTDAWEWEKHRDISASALADSDWELLTLAYGLIRGLKDTCDYAQDPSVAPEIRAYADGDKVVVTRAITVLGCAKARLAAVARGNRLTRLAAQ